MGRTSMTTVGVRKFNRNQIYSFLYRQRRTSKLEVVNGLQIGLSTVTQNLRQLEEDGLICRNGFFDSTGGRKADALEVIPTARISIGVALLKEMALLVSIDLYGQPLSRVTLPLPYHDTPDYYARLGQGIDAFIRNEEYHTASILGVSIATQGIISPDGQQVSYGPIMGNTGMALAQFTPHIPYPCRLEHDSKAAAYLELWRNPQLKDGLVLLLNQNLGGAILAGGSILQGHAMRSGLLEHFSVHTDGGLCYCGKRGCLETYCSVDSLTQSAGMDVPLFFTQLRSGDPHCMQIWQSYLGYMALAFRNFSVLIDGFVVLSGYLAPYFIEEDLDYLLTQINLRAPFPLSRDQFIVGASGQYTSAIGTALHDISAFLEQV